MFQSRCPKCNKKELQVISGSFTANGLDLSEDGFDMAMAKSIDTNDEVVECQACHKTCSLSELMD